MILQAAVGFRGCAQPVMPKKKERSFLSQDGALYFVVKFSFQSTNKGSPSKSKSSEKCPNVEEFIIIYMISKHLPGLIFFGMLCWSLNYPWDSSRWNHPFGEKCLVHEFSKHLHSKSRSKRPTNSFLAGGTSNFIFFHPDPWGNDAIAYFSNGLVQPPTSFFWWAKTASNPWAPQENDQPCGEVVCVFCRARENAPFLDATPRIWVRGDHICLEITNVWDSMGHLWHPKFCENIIPKRVTDHKSLGIQSPENGNGTWVTMLRRWLDTPCSSAENMTIDA